MVKPVQVIVEAYAGKNTVARLGHRHIHRAPRVTTALASHTDARAQRYGCDLRERWSGQCLADRI